MRSPSPLVSTFVLATVALLGSALALPPARGDAATLLDYTGVWRQHDELEDARRRVSEAIDRAVDGMPFFIAPIAADRIGQRAGPFEEIRFRSDGEHLTFTADDWGPVTGVVGGHATTVRGPVGTELILRQWVTEDGRLVQKFEHEDAERINWFSLSGDRETLHMRVCLISARLPHDVDFSLRFRRVAGPR